MTAMKTLGKTAKKESAGIANNTAIVWLPLPNGIFQRFQIWESPLMEPELATKYPEISTYLLKGVDDPTFNGRMMISPDEFSAFFASLPNQQEVIIRKVFKTDATKYHSFWSKDDPAREDQISCLRKNEVPLEETENAAAQRMLAGVNETGDVLRVFRHAMTVIGALSQQQGWVTKGQALAGVVSFLGQINTVYERDVSIRFVLPVGEDQLLFLDDATDPFVTNGGDGTLEENQMLTDQLVGTENYDMGLVFVLGGCCGNRGAPCNATRAQNISPYNNLATTAHEIGHALSCSHTWTSCGPSNNGQFGTNEYGSGTSIMSYTGICGVDNILPTGDITYFGVYSQIQITNFLSTSTCYKTLPTGNHVPVSTVPASGFYIPVSTPFELVGSATDVDGDNLTYSWEQTNIRNVDFTASTISIQVPPTPADGNVPIARIFNPVTTPRRTIPQLSDLLANNSTVYERLPTYTRNIKYRMYVRDNHPGAGGTTPPQVSFEVDGTAGPFLVTAPNTPVSWASPSNQTVTWNVANTTNANVNCQNVKISLSVDGGYNYGYVLAASTANDGTQSVAIPAGINTGKARIKIEAAGNIFFDISNTNFTIGTPVASQANVAALDFDGSNDQVNLGNSFGNFGTGNFTIEMWVKTSDPSYSLLISKRATCSCGNFWNFFVNDGKFRAEFSEAGCANLLNLAGATTISDGKWHHLAATRSGTTLTLYVDGTPDATGTSAHNFNNPANVILGNSPCNGYFTGSMDEIRIWNVARTQEEINNAQYCRLNGIEPGLTALYHADDGTPNANNIGVTLFDDATANNYNGTYSGFALSGTSSNFVSPCTDALYTASGSITITGQPASQSGTVGQTITLTVAVTENVTYQWQVKPNGSGNFVNIFGATTSSLALTMTVALHNNQYRCVVRNGCNMLNSNAATLTLTCPAQTLSAITGEAVPCENNYYTYFVDPNASIATWNWTTPAGWAVTNFGNMIFVKPNGTAGNVTINGTDACGNTTGTKTKAVAPVLVQITTQPVSQTVNEGVPVNFTVAVSSGGGTTTYQWQQSTDFGASFSDISGAITATYNIASASVAHDDRRFRCIVSNTCLIDTSNVSTLDVNCTGSGPATPGSISGADLICAGAVLTYTVYTIPGASGYTWTLPSGWTGSSTTNSITVTANSAGGILKVKAVNACGMSAERSLSIAVNNTACLRAVHFDGVNDYLAVAQNSQAIQGEMTISFWVKPDRLTGMQTLIFNGKEFVVNLNGNRIQYQHSDNCCGYDGTVDKIFSASLTTGVWYFVALTRSTANRSLSLYLNGNFAETQTYSGAFAQPGDNTTSTMNFGAGINGDYLRFKGALDEIKIWNAIRSATQIKEDMFCVPAGNETNLKAYYGFEQGQPSGNNVALTQFTNAASAYLGAVVHNLAMTGPTSNVVNGSKSSAISGPSAICSGGGTITYTIDLPGTPTVTWTLPSGWTGSSTTESITVTPGANGGIIAAQATLSCGAVRLEKTVSTTPSLVNTTLLGGEALDFDGTNDYAQIPSGAVNLANSSMTIEFWAKRGTNGTQDFIVVQGNNGANTRLVIGFRNTNQFTFGFWSNDLNTTTTYTDNGWHHWACVYDNAIVSPNNNRFIYRDGVLVAGDRSGSNFAGSGALDIGRYESDFFGGQVDELRIWNVARSQAQITAGLYCPVTCAPSSLVLYLPMEDGTAGGNNTGLTGLQDFGSYANGSTLSGFALSGASSNVVTGVQVSLLQTMTTMDTETRPCPLHPAPPAVLLPIMPTATITTTPSTLTPPRFAATAWTMIATAIRILK
ncbi:MAG: hypothetical protein IPM98_06155 [Lewinellaceae bacterium]|nr:hypothetical protein [Lewinellaceae bacterium]